MNQFTEGTHYRRRENQPSPAPHRSKEAVDCLLCSDPGDDDDAQVGNVRRKRSRAIGQNIRLDRLHAHMRTFHPDACRFGTRSLLTMGFGNRVGAGRLPLAPTTVSEDPQIEASGSLGTAPSGSSQPSL